eukprot:CAMPEP_0174918228 /NCGR_PEP_ID=MMETSP1355-20121228/2953_1 /TAXON_ID=464990 /ORGANISM="Hemiselmis tepida, Strain CCMP443" /LENGTH=425 /DNA_ID=CAMNT_0016163393 /DNA_START=77 /DNA_END=1354 /DNA_ORIENTATION=+
MNTLSRGLITGLVVAIGCVPIADGQATDFTWVKSSTVTSTDGKNKTLCAGVAKTCDSMSTCTITAIGPCVGDATAPSVYLKSSFVGMGFVNEANYLSCGSTPKTCTVAANVKQLNPTGVGYRDAAVVRDPSYAWAMTGNVFGDLDVAGGYLGLASYLNTGQTDITQNYNDFNIAKAGSTARVDRSGTGGSAWGAPVGPYRVCISDVTPPATNATSYGTCGAARTFKPSEYKFSIFGYFSGTSYGTQVVAGQNGFPTGMSHMGVRMKIEAVGFSATGLQVNGRDYDPAKVSEDVTSFSITAGNGAKVTYTFPTKYNLGTTDGALTDQTMLNVFETKTIKIKIHSVGDGSMMIDYLFESASLAAGKYVVYDPTITMDPLAPPPPTTTTPPPNNGTLGENSGATCKPSSVAGLFLVTFALIHAMLRGA